MLFWMVSGTLGISACQPVHRLNVHSTSLANREALTCMEHIAKNPAYHDVATHLPLDGKDPTPAQLSDTEIPTPEEAHTLVAIHQEVIACREKTLANFSRIMPEFIPAAIQSYQAADEVMDQLIHLKLSWGAANSRKMAIKASMVDKLQAIQNQTLGNQ